jgi:hypothetical protein
LLLESPSRWATDGVDRQVLEPAQAVSAQLETSRAALEAIGSRPRHGLTGVLGRMGDSMQRSRLEAEIAKVTTDLRPHLLSLAQSAPTTTFPEADELRREASKLQQQAREATGSADQLEAACNQRADEIKRRHEAMKQMGFDSLYEAALLQAHGPSAVESPLILKRGEQAYFTSAATLARHKRRVTVRGASQGFSFPIGHTGIRYRVGTFRGEPVSRDYLAPIDSGTLVLTNQRLAFIGTQKSVAYQLPKILHVEAYTDGLGVFKEGRESADLFLFPHPQQFLMYLNYFLQQNTASS